MFGSVFYKNYMQYSSIVLLAATNANGVFLATDVEGVWP